MVGPYTGKSPTQPAHAPLPHLCFRARWVRNCLRRARHPAPAVSRIRNWLRRTCQPVLRKATHRAAKVDGVLADRTLLAVDARRPHSIGWKFPVEAREPSVAGQAVPSGFGGPGERGRPFPPKPSAEARSVIGWGARLIPVHCHPAAGHVTGSGGPDGALSRREADFPAQLPHRSLRSQTRA